MAVSSELVRGDRKGKRGRGASGECHARGARFDSFTDHETKRLAVSDPSGPDLAV